MSSSTPSSLGPDTLPPMLDFPLAAQMDAALERWPIATPFTIARGSKTHAETVTVTLYGAGAIGRGEAVPYRRYDEDPASVLAQLAAIKPQLGEGFTRAALQDMLPPGAARNALDCAAADLIAKLTGAPMTEILGAPAPIALPCTASTISLGSITEMREAAAMFAAQGPVQLKVKLGADANDVDRLEAVREAAPEARLIVDVNEGWDYATLLDSIDRVAATGAIALEQPLPAADDAQLAGTDWPLPIFADESAHTRRELDHLIGRYTGINIKLDKTGGVTEALALSEDARRAGFRIMVGCMVATSLAIAPALYVARPGDIVDLDGAALLAQDRREGLLYKDGLIYPPTPKLWG